VFLDFRRHLTGLTLRAMACAAEAVKGLRRASMNYTPDSVCATRKSGAPGAIPTRDLPLRRRTLYATELREHKRVNGKSYMVNVKATIFGIWPLVFVWFQGDVPMILHARLVVCSFLSR
jgi:hypothetical protein